MHGGKRKVTLAPFHLHCVIRVIRGSPPDHWRGRHIHFRSVGFWVTDYELGSCGCRAGAFDFDHAWHRCNRIAGLRFMAANAKASFVT